MHRSQVLATPPQPCYLFDFGNFLEKEDFRLIKKDTRDSFRFSKQKRKVFDVSPQKMKGASYESYRLMRRWDLLIR